MLLLKNLTSTPTPCSSSYLILVVLIQEAAYKEALKVYLPTLNSMPSSGMGDSTLAAITGMCFLVC